MYVQMRASICMSILHDGNLPFNAVRLTMELRRACRRFVRFSDDLAYIRIH